MLTAAARSTWPGTVEDLLTELFTFEGAGRGVAGTLGFPTKGFIPTGGFGLAATGGRELAGVASELEGVFFQGVADPLPAAIPGKTETGFAVALAAEGVISTLGAGAFLGGGAAGRGGAFCATGSR